MPTSPRPAFSDRRRTQPCGHKRLAECPLDVRDWEEVFNAWCGFLEVCRSVSNRAHERANRKEGNPTT